jgi:hypothetical protein
LLRKPITGIADCCARATSGHSGLQPIDKLTCSDFFPDIIGMEEHFAFGHLFRLLHAYSTG